MIENIVYSVLKQDSALAALLGATAADSRIYSVFAEPLSLPCIVFYSGSPVSANDTVWFYRQNFTFEIYAETVSQYNAIRNRLYTIFQKYDRFFNSSAMQTEGIIIKECHAVETEIISTYPDEYKQAVQGAAGFEFQFTKCANNAQ